MLVYFFALIAAFVLAGLFARGLSAELIALNLVAAAVIAPLAALYVGLRFYAPPDMSAAVLLRVTRPDRAALVVLCLGVAAGAALAPVANDLSVRVFGLWPIPLPEGSAELPSSSPGVGLMIALVVGQAVAGPIAEELLFRGFMQPALARTVGQGRAVVQIVGLYALAQLMFNPRFVPAALLVAAPLGVLALWAGNTWAAIAAHISMQLTPLALLLFDAPLPRFIDRDVPRLPAGVAAPLLAIAGIALAAAWRVARERDGGAGAREAQGWPPG